MTGTDQNNRPVQDRVDALNDVKPSLFNARNAAIFIAALVLAGGYFGAKAGGAGEEPKPGLNIEAAAARYATPPSRDSLFGHVAYTKAPADAGPSELEEQMATLMGAVQALGTRIEAVVTEERAPVKDPASDALLTELRSLAAKNEAMREQLQTRLDTVEDDKRAQERSRASLEMEIAELRAQMLSGPAFTAPAEFSNDDEPDAAEIAALAEVEHRRELERLRLEADLARQERLEEERLSRERESLAHIREKELRSLDAHYQGREAERESAATERQTAIARMSALEAERLVTDQARDEAERQRRSSGGVALDEGSPAQSANGTVPAQRSIQSVGNNSANAYRPTADEDFLATAAEAGVETVYAVNLPDPDRLVSQGTLIPGVMETAIQSDLPGGIRAVVSDPVWSADGSAVLLPAGSRLIGQYRSDIATGQTRVLIAWSRAITPDHRSIMLGSSGSDALGRAGQGGTVDTHFARKFEAAFLVSIVTGLANFGSTVPVAREYIDQGLDTGIGAVADAASGVLEEYLSTPPTIHVNQGAPVTVFVQRDLYL